MYESMGVVLCGLFINEVVSQWMPGYCKVQDSAAVLEELTCPKFEYGNTESGDVLSITGDDGHLTPELHTCCLTPGIMEV